MTGHTDKNSCPHCGKHLPEVKGTRRSSAMPLAILLCAVIFLLHMNNKPPVIEPVSPYNSAIPYEMIPYIAAPDADKSCGVCLASVKRSIEDKKLAAIKDNIKGMALVPAGEYEIGSPGGTGDTDEQPRHKVRLNAFYIDTHEISVADYMKFAEVAKDHYPEWARPDGKFNIETGRDPYYRRFAELFKTCGNCPVIGVTWENADAYCRWLNKRLPTEAEWETAARSGTQSKYSFGNSKISAGDHFWYERNSGGMPHPAGLKSPNQFGLYDMHGNVWEWVSDWYDEKYYAASPYENPAGPELGAIKTIRGGSWAFDADAARSANRAFYKKANDDIGFRCAVSESELTRQTIH